MELLRFATPVLDRYITPPLVVALLLINDKSGTFKDADYIVV